MSSSLRQFFARHPLVRDALLWAIPALLLGAFLRALLLSYMPYAYWGADSRSYFSFAHRLLAEGQISLDEKRRYLYPILLLPVTALPGAPLRWLAWLQHGLGLATLLPLAYVVRKNFALWRLWIVPVTLIYASLPIVIWYEHELLGENVFYASVIWAFAGWCAWVGEARRARAFRLWWWFFVPLACFFLTKPSGRLMWIGVFVALTGVKAWLRLDWRQIVALLALLLVTFTVGSRKLGARILYTSVFPLTRLETPLHAEYKEEIRGMVETMRANIDTYYLDNDKAYDFLDETDRQDFAPKWKALAKDEKRKAKVCTELAVEAIKARPDLVIYLALQRFLFSANLEQFQDKHFEPTYYPRAFEHHYVRAAAEVAERKSTPIPLAFGFPKRGPIPPLEEFKMMLSPRPDSWPVSTMQAWHRAYEDAATLVQFPKSKDRALLAISHARPSFLGCWLVAGLVLSFSPRYRRTLGAWTVIIFSYLFGVYMISQVSPRFFGAAWGVLIPTLAVPADFLASFFLRRRA